MIPKIHHPRVLLLLLLVIGAVAAATVVMAGGRDPMGGQAIPFPVPPPPPPLSEGEKQAAVDIVRESGVVDRIAGGQPWTASRIYRTTVAGASNAIRFEANWEQPVESSGPWLIVKCQGTRLRAVSHAFGNLKQLGIHVDVEHRKVVGVGASANSPHDDPPGSPLVVSNVNPKDPVKVSEIETGKVLYEGPQGTTPEEARRCPPGKADDD